MQVVAGQACEQLVRAGEDGHLRPDECNGLVDRAAECEDRSGAMACGERPLEHERRLRDVQTVRPAPVLEQHVCRMPEVGQPRVGRVNDLYDRHPVTGPE